MAEPEMYTDKYTYKYPTKISMVANGFVLPDPSSWTYQVGDLDTSGSRDSTGTLHRAYVATKINYELSWNALEWEVLSDILNAVNASPKFRFSGPDPRNFKMRYEGYYYVGDRTGEVKFFRMEDEKKETAMFSLKMKFIEY